MQAWQMNAIGPAARRGSPRRFDHFREWVASGPRFPGGVAPADTASGTLGCLRRPRVEMRLYCEGLEHQSRHEVRCSHCYTPSAVLRRLTGSIAIRGEDRLADESGGIARRVRVARRPHLTRSMLQWHYNFCPRRATHSPFHGLSPAGNGDGVHLVRAARTALARLSGFAGCEGIK
jgi:hypothetical protein